MKQDKQGMLPGYFKKENILFLILGTFMVTNAVVAEFIGVKIFSVERLLGFEPLNLTLWGAENLSINMSAGILNWPVVFIMTDILNEYFGRRAVRFITWIAIIFILYAFGMVWMAISVPPADIWVNEQLDLNLAFNFVFGQGLWNIFGSVTAFAIGQLVDVTVFHRIKLITGEKLLWLRATGSTVVSQWIDTVVVTFILFYFNPNFHWPFMQVLAIAMVGYTYKFVIALLTTPFIYLAHFVIDRYLGPARSQKLVKQAIEF